MLEAIDEKRSRISGVEAKLAELNEQQQDKEDEMKGLERNLVKVVVEQQMEFLKTLTSVGAVGTTLSAASKLNGRVLFFKSLVWTKIRPRAPRAAEGDSHLRGGQGGGTPTSVGAVPPPVGTTKGRPRKIKLKHET
jgi:hypothetical protein